MHFTWSHIGTGSLQILDNWNAFPNNFRSCSCTHFTYSKQQLNKWVKFVTDPWPYSLIVNMCYSKTQC